MRSPSPRLMEASSPIFNVAPAMSVDDPKAMIMAQDMALSVGRSFEERKALPVLSSLDA
jgi:rRNA processing protein Krr1/Pno1